MFQAHNAFPTWYSATRFKTAPFWRTDVTRVYDPQFSAILTLVDQDAEAALKRADSFEAARALALAIVTDVHRSIHRTSTQRERLGLRILGIAAVVPVAEAYLAAGRIRDSVELMMQPLLDEKGSNLQATTDLAELLNRDRFVTENGGAVRLARHLRMLLIADRFTSWLRDIPVRLADHLDAWIARWLRADPAAFIGTALEFEHWAVQLALPSRAATRALSEARTRGSLDDTAEACLEYLSILRQHLGGDHQVRSAAQQALARFSRHLNRTQQLHLMTISFEHSDSVVADEFEALVGAIRLCMTDWATRTPDPMLLAERRGLHWRIMGPVMLRLVAASRGDLLVVALGAWLGLDPSAVREDVVFLILSGRRQCGWIYQETAALGEPPVSLDQLIRITGLMRGEARQLEGSSDDWEAPRRVGIPDDSYAAPAAALMAESLMPDRKDAVLAEVASAPPRAMVPLPYVGISPQAIMVRKGQQTLPWCTSFQSPLPDATLSRVAVVWTGTSLGVLEARGITAIFQGAGLDVEAVIDEGLTRARFLEIYRDPIIDLVWLAGHAQFDGRRPERSSIVLPNGLSEVTPTDLREGLPIRRQRRLFVMNVCDAAATLMHGGVAEYGLATMASAPQQAVIGHAWPVHGWPYASLFGRLLADQLVRSSGSHFHAYVSALEALFGAEGAVVDRLDGAAGELDLRLAGALSAPDAGTGLAYTQWGSPAFLE